MKRPFDVTRREVLRAGALAAGAAIVDTRLARGEAVASAVVADLRCEAMSEPLGVQSLRPRLSWSFAEAVEGYRQVAYRIVVMQDLPNGTVVWDSGQVSSSEIATEYGGPPAKAHRSLYWMVRCWGEQGEDSGWSKVARWSLGPLNDADWLGAKWIARDVVLEGTEIRMAGAPQVPLEPDFYPAPYLRKEFEATGEITSAFLYICGLGYAEVYLNSAKLDAHPAMPRERDPGFTNFNKSVLYVTHDVSKLVQTGQNAIGIILGTGWYDVHDVATWHFNTATWRARPKTKLVLVMTHKDGSTSTVISDESWKTSSGPILRDGVYTGEVYDARLEMPGWNAGGFNHDAWKPALCVDPPLGTMRPLLCEPVRITQTLVPKGITEPQPAVFVVDMGQNFAGHAQLRLKCDAGTTVTLRYSELMGQDGMIDTHRIDHFMQQTRPRQPFQQDTYIAKGGGLEEFWEQRFSYAGFRYVEVRGFPGQLAENNLLGRVAQTAMDRAGDFACSDPIANAIQHAAVWSYRSNAQSIPTDCPHREKNGWTGDAGLAVECGLMNFKAEAFYLKWLEDFRESQRADGGFPVIIPNGGWGNGEAWPGPITPPWDGAYATIVWQMYRYHGDKRLLARHIDPLRKYVDYFLAHRDKSGLTPGLGLGDWLPWKTVTPTDFISNAYLLMNLDVVLEMAQILGQTEVVHRYSPERAAVHTAFQESFYHAATHTYSVGSQTAQSTALYFGLVPEEERAGVFAKLVRDVEAMGHLDVGILGAKFLLRVLSEGGRTDLAWKIATQTEMPGWGYWMKTGATTLWEDWKGGSSYNHIMFGDVSAWFYQWIAGVQPESKSIGWQSIRIRPHAVGSLTSAQARYVTPRGEVACSWKREGRSMAIDVTVPCSATAVLEVQHGANLVALRGRKISGAKVTLEPGKHRVMAMLPAQS
jgi:alpha-L-rhamnosidase